MRRIIAMNRFNNFRLLKNSITASSPFRDRPDSAGATLTEILMALMVMGIGLVSVASLFPLSMLRSAQATKLTNGVLLKLQCEEYIQAFPELSRNNFDSNYPTDPLYPTPFTSLGNIELSPRSLIWNRHGITDRSNPADQRGATAITNLRNNLPINVVSVVDPIGASFNTVADAKTYGKDPYGLHTVTALYYAVDRKNGNFNLANSFQKSQAFSMFASNDNWKPYLSSIEVIGGGAGATSVTLNDASGEDVAEFFTAVKSGSPGRVVLVDINGKQSHVSPMDFSVAPLNNPPPYAPSNVVPFLYPLPANGLYGAISEVRLELYEARYTCMVTLRKQLVSLGASGTPGDHLVDDDNDGFVDNLTEVGWPTASSEQEKDVVRILGGDLIVFFRRDYSPLAEQVYGVENLVKGQVGIQPQEVRIRWKSAEPDAKPRIRQGGYVFDSRNGYWYQIRTVIEEDRAVPAGRLAATPWIDSTNDREAVIMLDRSPEATGQFLMVPENVVEVFEFSAY